MDSPCINAAHPNLTDPDGTRRDMGGCHYPFISIACAPQDVDVSPGDIFELSLTAENLLTEASFPVYVEVYALLPSGAEILVDGPFPPSGIALPAESSITGTRRLRVPMNVPDGLEVLLKTVLSSSETGDYVYEDYCELTVVY